MTVAMVLILAVVAAGLVCAAYAFGRMHKDPEQPKRFGLKEAEVAATHAENAEAVLAPYLPADPKVHEAVKKAAAQTVLGSMMSVGYENKVAEDLQKLMGEKDAEAVKCAEELKANVAEIRRLEAEIEKVMNANDDLSLRADNAVRFVAEKAKVAALFQG